MSSPPDTDLVVAMTWAVPVRVITISGIRPRVGVPVCEIRLRISVRVISGRVIRRRITVRVISGRVITRRITGRLISVSVVRPTLIDDVRSGLIHHDPTSRWTHYHPPSLHK